MARETLNYTLNKLSLQGGGAHSHKESLSDLTIKSYKSSNAKFADFCKSEFGIKTMSALEKRGVTSTINDYVRYLDYNGKSAHTIHTMIAPVCKACDVSMRSIDHPSRVSADIKRGRYAVERSERESNLGRYELSVNLEKAIGCRRSDLEKLTGGCLRESKDGKLYVWLPHGKGGKNQLQRILPEHADFVRKEISARANGEKVLTKEQMSKNINYHGYRADLAKEAYNYYKALLSDPKQRERYQQYLIHKYEKLGKPSEKALQHFKREVYNNEPYKLRGNNLKLALEKGLPIEYDRLAVLCVSVEHLSHWRNDVTINNYLLA